MTTLNSETGAVGAHLPSPWSLVPSLWSSKTPETQSEKSEKIDSKNTLSNGRTASQKLPAETSTAVTTLAITAKIFKLSPVNQRIVGSLAKDASEIFKQYEPIIPLPTENPETKKPAPSGLSSYVPSFGLKNVGGTLGYTGGYMYAETALALLATKVSTFMFGNGLIGAINAKVFTAAAISYGAIPAMAAGATIIGATALPLARDGVVALHNKVRGKAIQPAKPPEKNPEIVNVIENSPLSKVITFKEGAYYLGTNELEKDDDISINYLLKSDTVYQICDQILKSDQPGDLFKTYIRERSDSKKVLADGYVCTPEEAKLLTKAGNLLRVPNFTQERAEIVSAIELLAEHHKPAKESKIFSERFKPTVDEAFRKTISNDPMLVEMSDGTFGFEDDKGVISLISNEMAATIRAENEEYINYVERRDMDAFVKIENIEEPKTDPVVPKSFFDRLKTGWLKA